MVGGIIHCCVADMPGAYARTSAFALNNRTTKYGFTLAHMGLDEACKADLSLKNGLNMCGCRITFRPLAEAFGLEDGYTPVEEVLGLTEKMFHIGHWKIVSECTRGEGRGLRLVFT